MEQTWLQDGDGIYVEIDLDGVMEELDPGWATFEPAPFVEEGR